MGCGFICSDAMISAFFKNAKQGPRAPSPSESGVQINVIAQRAPKVLPLPEFQKRKLMSHAVLRGKILDSQSLFINTIAASRIATTILEAKAKGLSTKFRRA